MTGQLVAYCIDKGKTLETLSLDEYQAMHPLFEEGVYDAIDLMNCVNGRRVLGGPAREAVVHRATGSRPSGRKRR